MYILECVRKLLVFSTDAYPVMFLMCIDITMLCSRHSCHQTNVFFMYMWISSDPSNHNWVMLTDSHLPFHLTHRMYLSEGDIILVMCRHFHHLLGCLIKLPIAQSSLLTGADCSVPISRCN